MPSKEATEPSSAGRTSRSVVVPVVVVATPETIAALIFGPSTFVTLCSNPSLNFFLPSVACYENDQFSEADEQGYQDKDIRHRGTPPCTLISFRHGEAIPIYAMRANNAVFCSSVKC